MRFSSLAATILLQSAQRTLAFGPNPLPLALSASARARAFPALRIHATVNEFDIWWQERQACNTVEARRQGLAAVATETLPVEPENVGLVLTEFVQSDFCRKVCNHHNIQPTDYGQIYGIFESVYLHESSVILKLKRVFGDRNDGILDRVTRYLRARLPDLKAVQVEHRDGANIY